MNGAASSYPPTTANRVVDEWAIRDDVVRLRVWGTQQVFPLFPDRSGPITIGTAPTCSIQVEDATRRVSRTHALLQVVNGQWTIADRSRNGLLRDRTKVEKFVLTPGVEIGLGGGVVLVAESARLMVLRNSLARWLGWSDARAESVDLALHAVRLTAQRNATLVLCGEDVVALAEELHRLTLEDRPFVLVHPRRRTSDWDWKPTTRCAPTGLMALAEAARGTVCLHTKRLPSDLPKLISELREPTCQVQLMVCTATANERSASVFAAQPVIVPALKSRRDELDRIVHDYEAAAAPPHELPEHWLSSVERAWIKERMTTVAEVERAVLRLAAIATAGSVSAGAARLGVHHDTLHEWLRSERYPRTAMDHVARRAELTSRSSRRMRNSAP